MRLMLTSRWVGVDIRLGREDASEPDERGPGALSADLTISTSDAAAEWTTYEDRGFGLTGGTRNGA